MFKIRWLKYMTEHVMKNSAQSTAEGYTLQLNQFNDETSYAPVFHFGVSGCFISNISGHRDSMFGVWLWRKNADKNDTFGKLSRRSQ